jgi:hypothetical protein
VFLNEEDGKIVRNSYDEIYDEEAEEVVLELTLTKEEDLEKLDELMIWPIAFQGMLSEMQTGGETSDEEESSFDVEKTSGNCIRNVSSSNR